VTRPDRQNEPDIKRAGAFLIQFRQSLDVFLRFRKVLIAVSSKIRSSLLRSAGQKSSGVSFRTSHTEVTFPPQPRNNATSGIVFVIDYVSLTPCYIHLRFLLRERQRMSLWEIIIVSLVLFGAGFGVFILYRLRAEPVEDPDDLERVRSIEEARGMRKPQHPPSASLPATLVQALLPWSVTVGNLNL
jgi:hypothetical protein